MAPPGEFWNFHLELQFPDSPPHTFVAVCGRLKLKFENRPRVAKYIQLSYRLIPILTILLAQSKVGGLQILGTPHFVNMLNL